jgi:FMN phosphatase YigB (HAD superfamily)
MIKLIATDMDGTLLNAAHEISEENINAIKYAQSKLLHHLNKYKALLNLFQPWACLLHKTHDPLQ